MQEKNFDEWNEVKKDVDQRKSDKKIVIGKIYWCNVGVNVGREVYGKGSKFVRPVLVLNVLPNGTFLGVPLSSQTKNKAGFMFHKFEDSKQNTQVALLAQTRMFDIRRKMGSISSVDNQTLQKIKEKYKKYIVR